MYTVNAAFRHYDTAEASFRNYVKFIQGPRYVKAGVTKAQSPQEQFEKIHAAGYATDVAYSNKLKNIFNSVKSWAVKNPVKAAGSGLATALVFFCSLST